MIRLASSSPTRANILTDANIAFIQSHIDIDERSIKAISAKSYVYSVALAKFKFALEKFGFETPLLVADTVISVKDKLLFKPTNRDEAREFLLLQSGNRVDIITAMFFKSKKIELSDISLTSYLFKTFNKDDLEEYINSNEWSGKAGGCMVEGFCSKYIESVYGFKSNAMGLCVENLKAFL